MSESATVAECELVDIPADVRITIAEEFASLIPMLAADERKELEASIVEHGGARDPLIVWDRGEMMPPILLDGHNRVEICGRLGLPYTVKGIRFDSKQQAIAWMERNQLGRRNLSRESFAIILGRLHNQTKLKKGGQTKENKGKGKTRERLAKEYGVDARTVEKAGKFQAAAVKLGVEGEIASGRMRVPQYRLIDAAKSLQANPTREEAAEAIRQAMSAPAKKCGRDPPRSQSWLLPSDPADCLKAIDFYARSYMVRAPRELEALMRLLERLVDEATVHMGHHDG